MKRITLPSEGLGRRRVMHLDLRRDSHAEADSLREDLESDLRRVDRSVSSLAEELTEAALEGIRRYRRERAEASDERSLRRIPLHAARATVVAIEAAEGTGDEFERLLDESVLRRRLRRAMRR